MKPFDLELVKQGAPCRTRDGRKARVICVDRKDPKNHGNLIALVLGREGRYEAIAQYNLQGCEVNYCSNYDLVIDDDNDEG